MRDMVQHDGRCRTCGRPLGGDEHEVDGVPGVFHLECLPGCFVPLALPANHSEHILDMVDQAREIIASGCGCDRDCEKHGETCGCRSDAEKVLALTTKQEAALQFIADEGQIFDRTNPKGTA